MKVKQLLLYYKKMTMTENLTKQTFLEKVFNYEKNKDWVYEGKLPSIIFIFLFLTSMKVEC